MSIPEILRYDKRKIQEIMIFLHSMKKQEIMIFLHSMKKDVCRSDFFNQRVGIFTKIERSLGESVIAFADGIDFLKNLKISPIKVKSDLTMRIQQTRIRGRL